MIHRLTESYLYFQSDDQFIDLFMIGGIVLIFILILAIGFMFSESMKQFLRVVLTASLVFLMLASTVVLLIYREVDDVVKQLPEHRYVIKDARYVNGHTVVKVKDESLYIDGRHEEYGAGDVVAVKRIKDKVVHIQKSE